MNVNEAFPRHARALDWVDIIDRKPSELPVPSPEAQFKCVQGFRHLGPVVTEVFAVLAHKIATND